MLPFEDAADRPFGGVFVSGSIRPVRVRGADLHRNPLVQCFPRDAGCSSDFRCRKLIASNQLVDKTSPIPEKPSGFFHFDLERAFGWFG